MSPRCALPCAVFLTAALVGYGAIAPHANGSPAGALNGTFRAQSNGDWAQTNDQYRNETTVVATWTITTTCADGLCSGEVHSDQGWTAPINNQAAGEWHVKRTVADWETCPDGTTVAGNQLYRFYPVAGITGLVDDTQSDVFAGRDITQGPGGGCGINKPLVISVPFKLTRIS
ncbi:hypothetical protein [Mycobacterium sp. RTGN5]|uniref:hypothetical protein n=1 Tax=Mycobacterium sp. RTGN5 TaxID=3016522 RepID=UPI0029C8299E|nr:hypothetical protein [Mycobacterium sp. RTGN5]